ncbi:hypothetical protein AHF37_12212 [Paragonimus kellicotti]|nr:hypothetical protein AHF37_12212 [Paragonimus kellicotti]
MSYAFCSITVLAACHFTNGFSIGFRRSTASYVAFAHASSSVESPVSLCFDDCFLSGSMAFVVSSLCFSTRMFSIVMFLFTIQV